MDVIDFGNLMTAMVTPFDKDLEVDYIRLQELSLNLIDQKSTALVVCGTTGESPTLNREEKLNVIRSVKEVTKNKVPLIAGTGSYNTKETISLSKEAELSGADALLIVNPYYNKPDQRGLYEHFKAIANSVTLPIIVYNHPGRTGVCVEAQTIKKLAEVDNIVAVKDSSCNLDLMQQYKKVLPEDFKIFSGDDSMNFSIYCLGGVGAISVASHVAGKEISEMFDALDKKDIERAREIHYSLIDLFKVLFCAPSPAPVKAALSMKGINVGGVRLPLMDLTENDYNKVKDVIKRLYSIN
ncbi:4-hydroxy-tetrahydrodipicolinate synthase [bacterium]|nr:MAG: 4-hydroxy-tetrahydrodipicolinate synthase [bacterium]